MVKIKSSFYFKNWNHVLFFLKFDWKRSNHLLFLASEWTDEGHCPDTRLGTQLRVTSQLHITQESNSQITTSTKFTITDSEMW